MKSSHSQPFICIDIVLTVAEIPPGSAMAASSEHIGLDNNYTEDRDMWWASNYSNLTLIHNGVLFNETSLFDDVTNSTEDPHPPSSSSEPPPSFPFSGLPLAGILSISLACYLLIVFLLTSLHSCSTGQGLAA